MLSMIFKMFLSFFKKEIASADFLKIMIQNDYFCNLFV